MNPDRTAFDEMQLKIWQDAIGLKQKRLAELEQPEQSE
jgi:hypothetical protein